MGLQKTKELNNGYSVGYWRIVRVNHLAKDGTEIVLGGFKDKAISDKLGDSAIIAVENFSFPIEKKTVIDENVYAEAYKRIVESRIDPETKEETNWFADAKSV